MVVNRLNLIIYIVLAIVILGMGFMISRLNSKVESLSSYENLYQIEHQQAQKFKDDAGHWRSRAQVAEVTADNLGDISELKNLSKEFKELKKSLKNLENFSQVSTTTDIHRTVKLKDTTIITVDNIYMAGKGFEYKDQYESISGSIVGDSISWSIQHKDSLQIVQYWDRKWFLGKKKYYSEIKSLNPNTQISYQKNIKTKRKRGLFY